jgi:signal peptidase II
VDQVLKHFATIQLQASEPVTLIKNILELTYLQNSGAAFGIMQKKFSCLLSLLL